MVDFTGGTWRSLIDGSEVGAIPDSENLHAHYDAQEINANDQDTVTTWGDLSGNDFDATGNGATYVTDGINGNASLSFDGTDDQFDVSTSDWATISTPFAVFAIVELADDNESNQMFITGNVENDLHALRWSPGEWELRLTGDALSGSGDGTVQQISGIYDGGESEIREEGTQTGTSDIGSGNIENISIGNRGLDQTGYWDGMIGEILVYEQIPTISDVESYLIDKWNV